MQRGYVTTLHTSAHRGIVLEALAYCRKLFAPRWKRSGGFCLLSLSGTHKLSILRHAATTERGSAGMVYIRDTACCNAGRTLTFPFLVQAPVSGPHIFPRRPVHTLPECLSVCATSGSNSSFETVATGRQQMIN